MATMARGTAAGVILSWYGVGSALLIFFGAWCGGIQAGASPSHATTSLDLRILVLGGGGQGDIDGSDLIAASLVVRGIFLAVVSMRERPFRSVDRWSGCCGTNCAVLLVPRTSILFHFLPFFTSLDIASTSTRFNASILLPFSSPLKNSST